MRNGSRTSTLVTVKSYTEIESNNFFCVRCSKEFRDAKAVLHTAHGINDQRSQK